MITRTWIHCARGFFCVLHWLQWGVYFAAVAEQLEEGGWEERWCWITLTHHKTHPSSKIQSCPSVRACAGVLGPKNHTSWRFNTKSSRQHHNHDAPVAADVRRGNCSTALPPGSPRFLPLLNAMLYVLFGDWLQVTVSFRVWLPCRDVTWRGTVPRRLVDVTGDKLLIIFLFLDLVTHSRQLKIPHARTMMKGKVCDYFAILFSSTPQLPVSL